VTARVLPDQPGRVVIDKIEGDNGRLSLNAAENCIGIAAIETLKLIGQPSCGVALTLHKVRRLDGAARRAACAAGGRHRRRRGRQAGCCRPLPRPAYCRHRRGSRARPHAPAPPPPRPPSRPPQGLPLGSGMGSSAASAAASAWAVNGLFGSPVSKDDLVLAGLASEAAVSGYHADNVGPSLLGGFVLVRRAGGRRLGVWAWRRRCHGRGGRQLLGGVGRADRSGGVGNGQQRRCFTGRLTPLPSPPPHPSLTPPQELRPSRARPPAFWLPLAALLCSREPPLRGAHEADARRAAAGCSVQEHGAQLHAGRRAGGGDPAGCGGGAAAPGGRGWGRGGARPSAAAAGEQEPGGRGAAEAAAVRGAGGRRGAVILI
jgi:hypothetical protein